MSELTHVQKLSAPTLMQTAVVLAPIFAHKYDFSDPKRDYAAIMEHSFALAREFVGKIETLHAEALAKDTAIAEKLAAEKEKQRLKDEAAAREAKAAETPKEDAKK